MIEQHANGNLRQREADEIQRRQQTEVHDGQAEIVCDKRREAEIDAPEYIGNEVSGGEQKKRLSGERRTTCDDERGVGLFLKRQFLTGAAK